MDYEYREDEGPRDILTVSEITERVKGTLEEEYKSVWVEGEISNFARPMSGHCYLTLKDKDSQIRVVIFKYCAQKLTFKLENGLKVLVYGNVTVYPSRGEYQLMGLRVEPKGIGALQLAFEQLKKKLHAEGLFDEEHKKEIPFLPQRIGVVTSGTGAAIRDILHVLDRRFANMHILIVPVKVQGDGAAEEIARAIAMLNEYHDVDIMIVGRGGGSIEDLWAFNEEIVARAIYDSVIPVISAVGHEVDFTISDFVADMRAPTPSVAAEMVVARKDLLEERVRDCAMRITRNIAVCIDRKKQQLDVLRNSYFFRQPRTIIEQYVLRLDDLINTLTSQMTMCFKERSMMFVQVCEKLEMLSPLGVLARGYSVTYNEHGSVVKKVADAVVGGAITTRVCNGVIHSQVTNIVSDA